MSFLHNIHTLHNQTYFQASVTCCLYSQSLLSHGTTNFNNFKALESELETATDWLLYFWNNVDKRLIEVRKLTKIFVCEIYKEIINR